MNRVKELLNKSIFLPLLTFCFLGVSIGQFITHNVIFCSHVVGSSMYPTYVDGEKVFVYKLKSPERDDIIIVNEGEKYVIKRCVGMPGDTIQILDGIVYIDGKEYEEPYIKDGNLCYSSGIAVNPIHLSEDEYFILGDNREISRDSRLIGAITEDMIVGVVV